MDGFGDPSGRGWVAIVAEAAAKRNLPIDVRGHGVPGDTSVQVAARWQREMQTLPQNAADLDIRAVFSFGANDSIREIPFDDSLSMLAELIDDAIARDIPVFVIGAAPVGEEPADTYLRKLSDAQAEACLARGVPFVAVHEALSVPGAWHDEATAGDGSHPGAAGYAQFADLAIDGGLIEWLLEEKRAILDRLIRL